MYAHLKALKSRQNKGADGKVVRMGGKGRLTDVVMKKLQKFYGKAIHCNVGNAKSMQDAVMAIYYHSSSTDSNPQHFLCPHGRTSWCKFKRCEATGETPPPHNHLP